MNNIFHKMRFFSCLPLFGKDFFFLMLLTCLTGTFFSACAPGGGRENLSFANSSSLQSNKNSQKYSRLLPAWQETAPGKKQWGFIDQAGHFIIPPVYEGAYAGLATNLLIVKQNGFWGAITSDQQVLLDFTYTSPLLFSYGFAPIKKNGLWGFINSQGQPAIQPKYEEVKLFIKDDKQLLARVKTKGAWGLIDATGNLVLTPRYELITDCYEGLIGIKIENKCGFINKKGELIIKPAFKNVKRFSYHLAPAQTEDGHWGYINTKGEFIIKPSYRDADYAEDADYYPVKQDKLWGYVDKSGHARLSPMYDEASPFYNGLARVVKKGVAGYITKQNKVIWDATSALYFMDDKSMQPDFKARLSAALEKQLELPGNTIKRIVKARPWGFADEATAETEESTAAPDAALNTESAIQKEPLSSNADWQRQKSWYGLLLRQPTAESKEELQWFWVELD